MATQLIPITSHVSSHACVRQVGDSSLPTVVLLHSFSTTHELFKPQYEDSALLAKVNFVGIDLLGHGGTSGLAEVVTYWDQAKMVIQVLDSLKLKSVYIMGTSQGGFVATRVALFEPERVQGLILLGTSLLEETSAFGSWDVKALLGPALPFLQGVEGETTPDFVLPQPFTDDVIGSGYGTQATPEQKVYVRSVHEEVYKGDAGRKRYLMIALALMNRDNLSPTQLASITVPILILHGTADIVYSVGLMKSWAEQLKGAKVDIEIIQDGTHFLSATSPEKVNEFVGSYLDKVLKKSLL